MSADAKKTSRLGGSPLGNMDLLSPTTGADQPTKPAPKAPKAQKKPAAPKKPASKPKVAEKAPVAPASTKTATAPTVAKASVATKAPAKTRTKAPTPPAAQPPAPEQTPEQQFGYNNDVKWPLLPASDPYLIEVPSSGNKILSTTITMRLPLDLERTVDTHCMNLRANKSSWIRHAMLRLLEAEQEVIKTGKQA